MALQSLCSTLRIPIVVALIAAALTMSPRSGDEAVAQEWQTIDCATSQYQIDGDATCQKATRTVGSGSTGSMTGDNLHVFGRRGSVTFRLTYYPPAPSGRPWAGYTLQESEKRIRANAAAGATQFGAYRGFDHTGYMEYRVSQRNCVGIDHGFPRGSDYDFFLRGEICSTDALREPARLVRELIAAVKIQRARGGGAPTASARRRSRCRGARRRARRPPLPPVRLPRRLRPSRRRRRRRRRRAVRPSSASASFRSCATRA